MENIEKIVVIGGGPAGLAAAIYAARGALKPVVVEGINPGGQLMQTSDVENYPGFPEGVQGPELIALYRKQAVRFETSFITDNVVSVMQNKSDSQVFDITLASGTILHSYTVLIATGAEALWLNIASEQRLRGKGVSACATCDAFFFRNKTVAVIGGGDTAMEEALTLAKLTQKVYLIHRRETLRASKIMQERVLATPSIEVLYNNEVVEVLGENNVKGVKVRTTKDGKTNEKEITLDGVFLAIGNKPSTDFLKNSSITLNEKGYVVTSAWKALEAARSGSLSVGPFNTKYQYMTSVSGIFAAGDCVDYVYRQAATAIGMGVAAALEIERYLEEIGK